MGPLKRVFQFGLFALVVCLPPTAAQAPAQSSPPQTPQAPQSSDPEDILRNFTSYSIKSDTVYLHRETLLNELGKRGEFSAWGLTATEDSKAADVVITVTLPFLTWEWNYKMVHQPTGTELGKGKISAAVEKTAAPQLAAMIVKRIGEARPLPASFQETVGTPQALANSGREKGKSWRVKYLSGNMMGIPKDSSVKLTVNRERIIVRASKNATFSVPASKVAAVASSTQVRKASSGWDQLWETSANKLGCGDSSCGAILLVPAIPVAMLGYGILAPMKTTQHFVTIYWLADGAVNIAELSVGLGDPKPLLAELEKATGQTVVDIQESIRKKKDWLAKTYSSSPIVKIDRKVSIGWGSLAPGEYRVISNPVWGGPAEVYFYPAKRESFDIDLVVQGVAQLERPITRLVSTVTYREQNGIVMLDQIQIREAILRFTPIPLGFAN